MKKLILLLAIPAILGCGGYENQYEEQTTQGVMVTDNVPFANESVQDIIDRGGIPPIGDRAAPDHHINQ